MNISRSRLGIAAAERLVGAEFAAAGASCAARGCSSIESSRLAATLVLPLGVGIIGSA